MIWIRRSKSTHRGGALRLAEPQKPGFRFAHPPRPKPKVQAKSHSDDQSRQVGSVGDPRRDEEAEQVQKCPENRRAHHRKRHEAEEDDHEGGDGRQRAHQTVDGSGGAYRRRQGVWSGNHVACVPDYPRDEEQHHERSSAYHPLHVDAEEEEREHVEEQMREVGVQKYRGDEHPRVSKSEGREEREVQPQVRDLLEGVGDDADPDEDERPLRRGGIRCVLCPSLAEGSLLFDKTLADGSVCSRR